MEYPNTSDFEIVFLHIWVPLQQWLSVDARSTCLEYLVDPGEVAQFVQRETPKKNHGSMGKNAGNYGFSH